MRLFDSRSGQTTERRPCRGRFRLAKATRLLHPLGAVVVADEDEPPLPFADEAFKKSWSSRPA